MSYKKSNENRKRSKNLKSVSTFLQRKHLIFSFIKGILRIPKKLDDIILILRDIEYELSLSNSNNNQNINPFLKSESSRNSQNGEDGIIDYILETFENLNINFERNFLEIGVGNGDENNTTQLLLRKFKGIWIDANEKNCNYINNKYADYKELLCINTLVEENNLEDLKNQITNFLNSKNLTFLSVDIDSIDSLVVNYFSEILKPLIIIVEINTAYSKSLYDFSKDPSFTNYDYSQGTTGYGASLESYKEILSRNYQYVYTERTGTNSFFIRNDKYEIIKDFIGSPIEKFSASQRFHLGNHDPKSGHKYTPPTRKQI